MEANVDHYKRKVKKNRDLRFVVLQKDVVDTWTDGAINERNIKKGFRKNNNIDNG